MKGSDQLLRCDRPKGLPANRTYLVPVDRAIEPDTKPAATPNIGRPKKPFRLRADQLTLYPRWSCTPQVRIVTVMVAGGPEHHEQFAGKEGRCSMARAFLYSGERSADLTDRSFNVTFGHPIQITAGLTPAITAPRLVHGQ